MQPWKPAESLGGRPVAVIGAGVLGRRIGCVWASGGFDVVLHDPNMTQCKQANDYIAENVNAYAQKTGKKPAKYQTASSLEQAVKDAWLVIECVPEKLEFKTKIFGELVALCRGDAILGSNSSSYKSSEMLTEVPDSSKSRVLNLHYYMPPSCMILELMTCGHTDPAIIEHLVEKSRDVGILPYVARKESTGFIFNRLWAAVKRETLTILVEGVSTPEEIDSMWNEMFVKGKSLPCKMMDSVGLDTVAFIESHYVKERGLSSEMTVDFLEREYISSQKLGNKSLNGGLYPPTSEVDQETNVSSKPRILALDVGLSSGSPSFKNAGEIVELAPDGQTKTLVRDQAMPDGIAVDAASNRMYWTCMGDPGKDDGAVYSADLDGTNIKTVVRPGSINTPKQLTLDPTSKFLYFCDREGTRAYRCKYDGTDLQELVDNRHTSTEADVMGWCVGIAVSPSLNKLFWTQKGPSKGGKGRIFSADLPPVDDRTGPVTNTQVLLDDLPEPIDLEFDEDSRTLFWTDRGEIPHGNTLNSIYLDENACKAVGGAQEVLASGFHEAIGLKLDLPNGKIYVADLGGSIYGCDVATKKKTVLFSDEKRAFTGLITI